MRCHSASRQGPSRRGAPIDFDFDRLELVAQSAEFVDEMAALARAIEKHGGQVDDRLMPPDDPKPTDAERQMLGEWLACGARR